MAKDIKRSKSLGDRTKTFLGLDSDSNIDEVDAWNQRRLKFCVNKYGNINCDKLKYEGLDTSLLGEIDEMDTSLPASSWSHAAPSLNRTITSCSRSYMVGSVLTPQSSVTMSGAPSTAKKKHAFRALATVVATTLSDHTEARKRQQDNRGQQLETICDDVEDQEIVECKSLPLESVPPAVVIESGKPSKTLRWSESLVDRVRSGVRRMDVRRRRFTDSFMGNFICCMPARTRDTKMLVTQIDDLPQYRPYFTYWICVVQIIVFVAALSYYGLAPIKLDLINREIGEVQTASASIEQVCRVDYVNLFIGLRQADLIRLGARYSPCMRQDKNLQREIIEEQRHRERKSGCCIRNDGGGCYQTSETLCSGTLATWTDTKHGRPVVCGLDPDFCDNPRSIAPFEWSEDVLQWPICRTQSPVNSSGSQTMATRTHMQCELTGRPCCIGSKAECVITTRQHCLFLRGYYHANAALCSQVNCLNEICGMLNFYNADRPDQFYRFFTAIFLNASIGSLVVTLIIHLTVMRDLEKMAGWHRVAIIYIISSMIGNLTSGIFLPYQVQTGSSGGIFSLLSMTFTEFLQSWKIVDQPLYVLIKFLALALFLFILGFLPFFDNYAHMSGLLSGVLLSFVLLPFVGRPSATVLLHVLNTAINPEEAFTKFQQDNHRRRLSIVIGCSILWLVLTIICLLLFYWTPVTSCSWCKFFNCIPLDAHFCDNMDVNITTKTACLLRD